MSHVQNTFATIWEKTNAVSSTGFNPVWHNGTGYFNRLVKEDFSKDLKIGDMTTSIDEAGRRLLIIRTRYGNVVLFERWSQDAEGKRSDTIVSNTPHQVLPLFSSPAHGPMSDEELYRLVGTSFFNIGHQIEQVCGA